ncbi:MAG: hypothetical protein JW940_11605 [Polyangiaceae bacterium]|nr:hypothetical protein [Polyangiaceae bacterium]
MQLNGWKRLGQHAGMRGARGGLAKSLAASGWGSGAAVAICRHAAELVQGQFLHARKPLQPWVWPGSLAGMQHNASGPSFLLARKQPEALTALKRLPGKHATALACLE